MDSDSLFDRREQLLSSKSNGEVDLGRPIPSPALLLSTTGFSGKWWTSLGGEAMWRIRWVACPHSVKKAARDDAESILGNVSTGTNMDTIRSLAECQSLCVLMDSMRTVATDECVAVDTPLAEALAVRKLDAPRTPCHEVIVSSLHHEIKSITRYSASRCFCYPRVGGVPHGYVAVGGVCLKKTNTLGGTFQPVVPGKLVIYEAEWMTPWAAALCMIGAVNTLLMAAFLVATPWNQSFSTYNPAFWFLLVNVVMEVVAIGVGWRMEHRWKLGWKRYLVRSDPFHALLTVESSDAIKVDWILGFEALGGVASVFGIAFTSGVPIEVLSALAIPAFSAFLGARLSKRTTLRTSLILGAMAFYLLEFVYEIIVLVILDDSILGWVVILSSIVESVSLIWIIATVIYALHFLSMNNQGVIPDRVPARIRDGTLTALRFPDLPTCGLMGTSALGSAALAKGAFVENGGSAIKEGTTSYQVCLADPMPQPAGWLSLAECSETSLADADRTTFAGSHAWLGDIVVACGLAIPVIV